MPVTLGMALTLPFAYRTPSLRKASGPSPLSGRAAATSHSRATVRVFAQAAPSSSSPGDSAAGQAANSPSQSSMRDTSRVVARAVMEDRSVTGSAAEAPVAAPPPKFDSPRGDTRGAIVLLEGVNVRVGSESLLEDLELRIEPGEKVGLIGANGCGKSTLLKCLMGKRDIDGGRMAISPSAEVGYLEQTAVSGSTKTVYEEARSQMPATAAALALARAEAEEQFLVGSTDVAAALAAAERLIQCRDDFEAAGGPTAERRIADVLEGLGFKRAQWELPCTQLSGGWQMRVALARLLLSAAGEGAVSRDGTASGGLLLLDEPSNHLDDQAAQWLARFLKRSSATTVLVSHDEGLLEGACSKYVEVRGKAFHLYKGTYSQFLIEREARAQAAQAMRERLDMKADKLEGFITRFGAKASKAATARSKQKALDKVVSERDEVGDYAAAADGAAGDASRVVLKLPRPTPGATEAIVMKEASFGWMCPEGPPQLTDVSINLQRGMRVVCLGPNGAGKSTFLAALTGKLPLVAGSRKVGEGVEVGVFTQDLAQELPQEMPALEYVLKVARTADSSTTDLQARTVMGSLGLTGTMALRKIGELSGGEKARVVLAAFVLKPCNCLILDEPSNHLDAASLTALTEALKNWNGALLAVTHNKNFVSEFQPTHILRVDNGTAKLDFCLTGATNEADFWEDEGAARQASAAKAGAGVRDRTAASRKAAEEAEALAPAYVNPRAERQKAQKEKAKAGKVKQAKR